VASTLLGRSSLVDCLEASVEAMSLSFTSEQDATAREALAVEGLTFSVATNRRPDVPAEGGGGGGGGGGGRQGGGGDSGGREWAQYRLARWRYVAPEEAQEPL